MTRPRLSELVKKHRAAVEAVTGACTCHEAHTSRDLIDPSCRFHECGEDVAELLDRIEALERQCDRQYWAGAKAGWNASQSDNPREAFEAIQRAYTSLPLEAK